MSGVVTFQPLEVLRGERAATDPGMVFATCYSQGTWHYSRRPRSRPNPRSRRPTGLRLRPGHPPRGKWAVIRVLMTDNRQNGRPVTPGEEPS